MLYYPFLFTYLQFSSISQPHSIPFILTIDVNIPIISTISSPNIRFLHFYLIISNFSSLTSQPSISLEIHFNFSTTSKDYEIIKNILSIHSPSGLYPPHLFPIPVIYQLTHFLLAFPDITYLLSKDIASIKSFLVLLS